MTTTVTNTARNTTTITTAITMTTIVTSTARSTTTITMIDGDMKSVFATRSSANSNAVRTNSAVRWSIASTKCAKKSSDESESSVTG